MQMYEKVNIKNYKGIKDLEVDNLCHVNLFVGSGCKTSLLQAIAIGHQGNSTGETLTTQDKVYKMMVDCFPRFLYPFSKDEKQIFHPLKKEYILPSSVFYREASQCEISLDGNTPFVIKRQEDTGYLSDAVVFSLIPEKRISKVEDLLWFDEAHITEDMRTAVSTMLPCSKEGELFMSLLQIPYKGNREAVHKPLDIRITSDSLLVYTELGATRFEHAGGSFIRYAWYIASILSKAPKYIFIDNIETGLHWRFFKPLMRFLVGYSERNNAQVFASTHSYEVIEELSNVLSNQDKGTLNVTHLMAKEDGVDSHQDSLDDLFFFVSNDVELR